MAAVRGGRWRMSVRTIRLLPDIPVRLRSMKSPRLTLKRDISRVKNPSKGWKFPWTPVSSFVAGTLFGFVADQFYHESWENLSGILTSGNFVQKLAARTTSGSGFDPPDSGNLPRSKRFNFVAEAVDIAAPAVVYIEVTTRGRGWHSFRGPSSSGSGFIVAENGLVLTNAHVVQDAVGVTVRLQDGRQFSGSVVDIDPSSDLAAIRLNAGEDIKFPTLRLGSSCDLRPGEWVVAMGSPLQLSNTITAGIVSTVHRPGEELGLPNRGMEYIQTDAAINVGNSGGPLVNLDGEVIGINAITVKFAAGISFAIPIDAAKDFLQGAVKAEKPTSQQRWYIGISMLTLTPHVMDQLRRDPRFASVTGGVFVAEVNYGSPAHRAGLHKGDIITSINGAKVVTSKQVYEYIKNGQTLTLEVQRGRALVRLEVQPQAVA